MGDAEPLLHVALYQPEIPPNTGNAGRLCLGIGARLHVVHPIGFSMDAKAVRRAGLDYWKHVDLMEHLSPEAFWAWVGQRRVTAFSTRTQVRYTDVPYEHGDVLLFGCETRGLPDSVIERCRTVQIPMSGPIRSMNLSNAVAVGAYGALQAIEGSVVGQG